MALSIFVDALPFTELNNNYSKWFENQQLASLLPNIAYSSSLHWQLYCDKYPDDRGVLVDWCMEDERDPKIRAISKYFCFMDDLGDLGIIFKKVLSKYIFKRNAFANIPFSLRGYFSEKGKYLFWDSETYRNESIFDRYVVVSQDEGHLSFDCAISKLHTTIETGAENIFFNTGFADSIGHVNRRGVRYSKMLSLGMKMLHDEIALYLQKHPTEEVLIISDHGMSTINEIIDFGLERHFGKQGKNSYIAYSDSCIMCVWVYDESLRASISNFLQSRNEGHLLTEEERAYYRAKNRKFGDYILILKEGVCFSNNWFGKSFKKQNANGCGMHGFWPEWSALNQLASIVLINGKRRLSERYTYPSANQLINEVMKKR